MNSIVLNNLTVQMQDVKILDNCCCIFKHDEITAIIGQNGSGKTTLLRTMLGIIKYTNGEINVLNRLVTYGNTRWLAKLVGYVPQINSFPSPISVQDYLDILSDGIFETNSKKKQACAEIISEFQINKLLSRRMASLSGGERQKVLIAGSLLGSPSFLLLDEPFTFLDPYQSFEISSLLCKISKNLNLGIIVVSHDIDWILKNTTRTVGLRRGVIILDKPTYELTGNIISEIYRQ